LSTVEGEYLHLENFCDKAMVNTYFPGTITASLPFRSVTVVNECVDIALLEVLRTEMQ
jgi:hypothetical protein